MPVETTATDSYREDLVSSGIVIKTEALTKVYEMGSERRSTRSAAWTYRFARASMWPSWGLLARESPL